MSDQELERVKQILVGDLKVALDSVDSKFAQKFEKDQFSQLVADVVAEALEDRVHSDDKVAEVLAPTIDQAIAGSIDQDPKKLAESLYPIMGPAIRKSISETLQQMLENFNQLLEESLSPKSLRWRFDAWRTGKSYSELVLLNTLEYRIEQVFLIHSETSLLIQHQMAELADAKDPDMVSSMFSAIQDFIEDSFSTDETNELNTLRLGDLTVVIQRGPAAILAAVVRGRVPENLRTNMIRLLESMHIKKRALLADYSGDPDDFLDIEPDVRKLLQTEKKAEEKKPFPWPAVVALIAIGLGIGYWQWLGYQLVEQQKLEVHEFAAEPGIVVLQASHSRNSLELQYFRDPDSVSPATIVNLEHPEYPVELEEIPFISTEAAILERRAMRLLAPEASTQLAIEGRSIYLSGTATVDWWHNAEANWPGVSGAEEIVTTDLELVNPRLDAIYDLKQQAESIVFEFERGSADLDIESPAFTNLVAVLQDLLVQAEDYGAAIDIDVIGFTDLTGTERVNRIIAQNRAETLMLYLTDAGIPPGVLSAHRSQDYEFASEINPETARETHLIIRLQP